MNARSNAFAPNRVPAIKTSLPRSLALLACLILLNSALLAPAQTPVQAWVQRYGAQTSLSGGSRAVAMGLDTNGNVFVTGSSVNGTNLGYATLKYSNAGALLWSARLDLPGNLSEVPAALAVDSSGNVFVTGSSSVPGNPAVAPSGYRYLTVAYSGSGMPLWTNSYSDGTGHARAVAIGVDQSGNVFVTGSSIESTNTHANMTTIAYSGSGVPLWTNRYKGAGVGGASSGTALALDTGGNVFVVGSSWGADGYQRYAAVAYYNSGLPLWTNQYIGPANVSDGANAVAVAASGNVLVTGQSYNTGGFYDYLTVAYSGIGTPLWTNRYGTANASDPTAIAVDNGGNVFVTGYSWSGVGFPHYATAAYSPTGVPLWTNRYNGPVQRTDEATAVATDGRGNLFVTGYSTGISSNYDYVTIGYSSAGVPLWTNRYNGPANGNDQATAIAVDSNGNIFVTGGSWNGTNYDFVTIKYSVVQPIPLLVQQLNNQVVLSWTNPLFRLQAALTLSGPFIEVPGAVSPYTNNAVGPQQFFRLISN